MNIVKYGLAFLFTGDT